MCHISPFKNEDSVVKLITMWTSGIEFDDYDAESKSLFPTATFVGVILFILLVHVIFMNLATGLAIDDINQIKSDSEAEKMLRRSSTFTPFRNYTIFSNHYFNVSILRKEITNSVHQ